MVNYGRMAGFLWRWLIMVGWQAMEMVNYGRMAGYGIMVAYLAGYGDG